VAYLNHDRLYEFRFRDVDQRSRQAVWAEIATDLYGRMGRPATLLDPAAGRCEFLNSVPASERWSIDQVDNSAYRAPGIHAIIADVLEAKLPDAHFDGVFVSNFLEHLASPDDVARFLAKMRTSLKPGGRIAVLGPNFRYCMKEYFDCADHMLALTHTAVAEHLYAAGFGVQTLLPKYLPYSFRGWLPPSPRLTRAYLRVPAAQRALGKQFLAIATR
jgi:SAM-dependent methyltransferase